MVQLCKYKSTMAVLGYMAVYIHNVLSHHWLHNETTHTCTQLKFSPHKHKKLVIIMLMLNYQLYTRISYKLEYLNLSCSTCCTILLLSSITSTSSFRNRSNNASATLSAKSKKNEFINNYNKNKSNNNNECTHAIRHLIEDLSYSSLVHIVCLLALTLSSVNSTPVFFSPRHYVRRLD